MKLRILVLAVITCTFCSNVFGQNTPTPTPTLSTQDTSKHSETKVIPEDSIMNKLRNMPDYRGIKGDSTVIPKSRAKQQASFLDGTTTYPPKPRNMWEVGIEGGTAFIASDVPSQLGWGGGLYVRKAIGYVLSLEVDGIYDVEYGLAWKHQTGLEFNTVLNGKTNPGLNYYKSPGYVYDNYYCQMENFNIDAVFALNNIGFHHAAKQRRFNLNGIVGIAGLLYNTHINQLNASGQPYPYSEIPANDTKTQTIAVLKGMLDNTYETEAYQQPGHAQLFNQWIDPGFNAGFQFQYHISKHFNVGAEFLLTLVHDRNLSGDQFQFNNSVGNYDAFHHEFITVGYAIGGKHNIEPLYWQNPLDYTYDALKTVRKSMSDMLKDSDGDGVPDYLDEEPNTPAGWPVDTHGVSLKLDKNGVPHYDEKGTFTPSTLVTGDLDSLKNQVNNMQKQINDVANHVSWFLPMIFFDLDKYNVKPEYYPELKYVATVMKSHTKIKVIVDGNADVRGSEKLNDSLAHRRAEHTVDYLVNTYGIDRDRFVVKSAGKDEPLVPGLKPYYPYKEDEQQVNRRVEFTVEDTSNQ